MALSPTSSRSAASSSGALTLISTTTNASAVQFDVAAIPGTYNDLILVWIARSAETGTVDTPTIRFNNDSGANYFSERIGGQGNNAISAAESRLGTSGLLGKVPAVSGLANAFGIHEIVIPGYASTAWLKTIQWQSMYLEATTANGMTTYASGNVWNSTAAITRVQINSGASAGFAIGSQLRIYGQL